MTKATAKRSQHFIQQRPTLLAAVCWELLGVVRWVWFQWKCWEYGIKASIVLDDFGWCCKPNRIRHAHTQSQQLGGAKFTFTLVNVTKHCWEWVGVIIIVEEEVEKVLDEGRFTQLPYHDCESNVGVNCWKHLATLGQNINQQCWALWDEMLVAFSRSLMFYLNKPVSWSAWLNYQEYIDICIYFFSFIFYS